MESVREFDTNLEDINDKCKQGMDRDAWFANKVSDAATGVSVIEFGNYLNAEYGSRGTVGV